MNRTTLLSLGIAAIFFGCEKMPKLPVGGADTDSAKQSSQDSNAKTEDDAPSNASVSDAKGSGNGSPSSKMSPSQIIAAFQQKSPTQITPKDILELSNLSGDLDQIEILDLHGSRLDSASMVAISKFTNLKDLNLEAASFGNGNLQSFSELHSLESLNVSRTAARNEDMSFLSGLSKLKSLRLAETVVDDDGLSQLTGLVSLEELDISATETVGVGLAVLGTKGAAAPLRILNASQTRIGAQGFRFVNQFPLEELRVSRSMVTDLSLAGLKGCSKLKVMDLSYNQLTDTGAKWLLSSKVLEELNLARNQGMTDGTLRRIQTISTLQQLDLTKVSCSTKAIESLKNRLPDCKVMIDGRAL